MTSTSPDPDEWWRDRAVLITGHTGFKGAWLALWLQSLGARVTGLSAGTPTLPSLYALARVGEHMQDELNVDVRDPRAVHEAINAALPEVVLHMAAQPMVRLSLREPTLTYAVNVMGTVNVLEGVRTAGDRVRGVVIVTSDKCYANPSAYGERDGARGGVRGEGGIRGEGGVVRRFRESDPLGGHDPYSSSKACAELVTAAYRESYFAAGDAPNVASARAGNVIGGGDFGEDRLVPDVLRAYAPGEPVRVRNPEAIRPWQHVLNPLSGYLQLARALCEPGGERFARAFNFGPALEDARTVRDIVERLDELMQGGLGYELDDAENPPEASRLELDSSEAEGRLGWRPRWSLQEGLKRVVDWHEAHRRGGDVRAASLAQIAEYGDLQAVRDRPAKTRITQAKAESKEFK
jgi:CDP-glucose 4,6-dehydratase